MLDRLTIPTLARVAAELIAETDATDDSDTRSAACQAVYTLNHMIEDTDAQQEDPDLWSFIDATAAAIVAAHNDSPAAPAGQVEETARQFIADYYTDPMEDHAGEVREAADAAEQEAALAARAAADYHQHAGTVLRALQDHAAHAAADTMRHAHRAAYAAKDAADLAIQVETTADAILRATPNDIARQEHTARTIAAAHADAQRATQAAQKAAGLIQDLTPNP